RSTAPRSRATRRAPTSARSRRPTRRPTSTWPPSPTRRSTSCASTWRSASSRSSRPPRRSARRSRSGSAGSTSTSTPASGTSPRRRRPSAPRATSGWSSPRRRDHLARMSVSKPSLDGVAELVAVIDRLRSPGGCPWYGEQSHASLVPYAIEEAFELVEAVETGARDDLLEELGDVLLQVVLHARLAQEGNQAPFDLDDVARGTAAKLVSRNPHVFAGARAPDIEAVEVRYAEL